MKTRLIPTLSLLILLLASCAPAAATEVPAQQPAAPVAVEPSATLVPDAAQAPSEPAAPTEAAASDPLPVATSRGPDLHATDPSTVSLASGQLQFVEFFRFT